MLERIYEGILFDVVRLGATFSGDDGRAMCKCAKSAEGSVPYVVGTIDDNDELQSSE
jgi:hypothetical protein